MRPPTVYANMTWKTARPEKIVADYRAGWTQRELAGREGCSQAAIHAFLHEQGIGPQPRGARLRPPPPEFAELHAAGLSQREIAKQLGVGVYRVRRWQRELLS